MCKNNRRDVGIDVQARFAEIGINCGNVVHSNVVHIMGRSQLDHVFGQVFLAWISGADLFTAVAHSSNRTSKISSFCWPSTLAELSSKVSSQSFFITNATFN